LQAPSVRRIHSQFFKGGINALKGVGRGGRHRENLSIEQEQLLLKRFFTRAQQGGILEVSEVKRAYEKKVGHIVPKSTVYRMLARHGWRKVVPRPRHPKTDEAAQSAFKKTL
jgi:transposase